MSVLAKSALYVQTPAREFHKACCLLFCPLTNYVDDNTFFWCQYKFQNTWNWSRKMNLLVCYKLHESQSGQIAGFFNKLRVWGKSLPRRKWYLYWAKRHIPLLGVRLGNRQLVLNALKRLYAMTSVKMWGWPFSKLLSWAVFSSLGLEFRIMCLPSSVISFITASSGGPV